MFHVVERPANPDDPNIRSFVGRSKFTVESINEVTHALRVLDQSLRGVNDQDIDRMQSVARQRAAGVNGGGGKCPWCGERALAPMPEDRRRQCGSCHRGAEFVFERGEWVWVKRTIRTKG